MADLLIIRNKCDRATEYTNWVGEGLKGYLEGEGHSVRDLADEDASPEKVAQWLRYGNQKTMRAVIAFDHGSAHAFFGEKGGAIEPVIDLGNVGRLTKKLHVYTLACSTNADGGLGETALEEGCFSWLGYKEPVYAAKSQSYKECIWSYIEALAQGKTMEDCEQALRQAYAARTGQSFIYQYNLDRLLLRRSADEMTINSHNRVTERSKAPRPPFRRLRAFAFDPSLSRRIETADINEVTLKIAWEDGLKVGPVDEYLEVVDYDPASGLFYPPVDLEDPNLLAQDGLPPSEANPLFHQQMVYAVARTTIRHFEEALGRRALWAPRIYKPKRGRLLRDEFVPRLRIYPHALREANAYYSPRKKALLFGYFPASTTTPGENLPGGTVFACLSHDIVAHETTHALLDGLHRRFIEPSNVDVWALHEAFADMVALFQHFTYPEVLRHQISRTRGDLERQNLLAQLAQQFGQAIGRYGALRDALGTTDPKTGKWKPEDPDPQAILRTTEPHARGAILVATVFDAFLTIYKWRIRDLLRIATQGTGELPPGELHPDLVDRLAQEAAKTARHILRMCIRALDYCPPVDVTFGDYLRALITADADMVTDDRWNYRLAVIEAFRDRGIYPRDVRNLSVESLLWDKPSEKDQDAYRRLFRQRKYNDRLRRVVRQWGLTADREDIYNECERSAAMLHGWFTEPTAGDAAKAAHLVLDPDTKKDFYRGKDDRPTLEVHSVRPARRMKPDGQTIADLVIEVTQRRRGYYERSVQDKADSGEARPPDPDFIFRGGCTLLVSLETGEVRYCVYKRIDSDRRLDSQREFLTSRLRPSLGASYYGDPARTYFKDLVEEAEGRKPLSIEPLALLHRSYEKQEV
ncbi:MAG: hypothetical protein GTO63_35030 [Anaerolineae bacterium]|nr:hypothetical protein [Anaerolineae bacterium]NIN99908.1 hypothetical protein [Anaerolineae bacterium]NIQ79345.1 hypothetical protein [Anaerolineae bacterium]